MNKQTLRLFKIFFFWRIALFIVAFFASRIFVNFKNSFPYANTALTPTGLPPWVWGFGNFDGVHYLRLAQNGYSSEFSQAFFPLYSLVIKALAAVGQIFIKSPSMDPGIYVYPIYFYSGLFLSNMFFLGALLVFYKLVMFDFNRKTAICSLLLLISFPTAFYFGAVYSESLFLILALGSIILTRKKRFFWAGVLAGFASATRIFGLLLTVVLGIELFIAVKEKSFKIRSWEFARSLSGVLLSSLGTLLYMVYLKLEFNNPFYFLSSQPHFGAQRSDQPVILMPQTIYRYSKILFSVPANSLPFWNAFLELSFALAFVVVLILGLKKVRLSYWVFSMGALLLPTLTGTFSSMPRYSLMGFLLFPLIVQNLGRYFKIVVVLFIILQVILLSLFVRGYWVA